jgi:hypothetical protein
MNRRIAGRVKQARKRAKVRADIRAGRRISMQAFVNGTHNHAPVAVEETPVATLKPEIFLAQVHGDTHELVEKENGDVVDRGTEYEMRKLRARLGAADYSVRKVK